MNVPLALYTSHMTPSTAIDGDAQQEAYEQCDKYSTENLLVGSSGTEDGQTGDGDKGDQTAAH